MRKIYLLCENRYCNPNLPYEVIEVYTNEKVAMENARHPMRWVQTWVPYRG